MKLTNEQLVITALSLAFIAMSLLYFQSLLTIKKIYNDSTLESLESVSASSTFIIINEPTSETTPGSPVPVVPPTVPVEPIILPPTPDKSCYLGGCSGQLCGDISIKDVVTTCEYRDEYACYGPPVSVCERQLSGQCGWTETAELNSCLLNKGSVYEVDESSSSEPEAI